MQASYDMHTEFGIRAHSCCRAHMLSMAIVTVEGMASWDGPIEARVSL